MINVRARRLCIAVLGTLILGACNDTDNEAPRPDGQLSAGDAPAAAPTAVAFDTATLTLLGSGEPVTMSVDVAVQPDQHAYGLMDRDELAPDAGMIFLYDDMQHPDGGFWMYRTRIPLDIAYFDGAGRIVAIRQMMPCTSLDPARCPGYSAGVPYFGAIEANRGFFTRSGIVVGDRIVLPGRIGS